MKFYATSRLSENILSTPEGYLICVGVPIARTGEMEYGEGETPIGVGPDGKAKVLRDASEVFRTETLKSFEGKSVTILHPKDLVTPVTWQDLTVGVMQNIRRGDGINENDLMADLLITDHKAIDLVKKGLREVSCGYEADYYETGVGLGEQKNIIGNHLALVPQGRAGASYAINDHKGKGLLMNFKDIVAALKGKKFPKAEVEELRAVANDSALVAETSSSPATYDDMKSCMDSMKKSMDEMMSKLSGMVKDPSAKDASTPPTESKPAEVKAVDAGSFEERMKKVEDALAGLTKPAADAEEKVEMEKTDDAEEEVEVDDAEEKEEEKKDEKKKTGDAAPEEEEESDSEEDDAAVSSRAEILAPGIKKEQTNLKAKALRVAYATTDGKEAIDLFTGGKAPDLKNEKFVDAIFIGVSEILKVKRTGEFSKTKTFDFKSNLGQPEGVMTPEKVNEMNLKHYAK